MLAHDASYDVAIQLEGTEAGIYCLSYQYLVLLSFFPSKMKWCCKMLSYVTKFLDFSFLCFQESLLSVLKMVLVPSPSARSEDISRSIISGAIYDTAMVIYRIRLFWWHVT